MTANKMNYYERFIRCQKCNHEMRLTTLWSPNRTGQQLEQAWEEEFKAEHSQFKHELVIEHTPWRKGH